MIEIMFKNGDMAHYNIDEYTDYRYDMKYFIVIKDKQCIGFYNLDCVEYIEVETSEETTTTRSSEVGSCMESEYPRWGDWLEEMGLISWEDSGDGVHSNMVPTFKMATQIPAEIANIR